MTPLVEVQDLTMRFGERLIQEHVSFDIQPATIFAIMGGSGCGKSTLLRHMIGLHEPASGHVRYDGMDYWAASEAKRNAVRRRFGVLFQSAALWSSMSVLDNVLLPLEQLTDLPAEEREARAREALGWVGLSDAAHVKPAELSGGMRKRAGLARAIVAQPRLLFLDEPSAGLDPVSSRRLDDLILSIRERTGAAVVLVSHELPSLFAIADDGLFLDAERKRPLARGSPRALREADVPAPVRAFLNREETTTP
ncbi:ATP-binding cassette domain-containing protein [uncultured Aquabacterium sp.]|jgi:phospholipid/cholesterol/gamma-HCH transport system ATP-binding protein|uniref:ABC transporter ATP-binding protein n=1 Tax=uncultured Aquabacterium sp. TaxID=158753 RepID=UPI0026052785|nr:ATP-binding cassette domain-containing protein [uncultured Aquabacterium sp.]